MKNLSNLKTKLLVVMLVVWSTGAWGQTDLYFGGTGTWTSAVWSVTNGTPYTTAWTTGSNAIFNIANSIITFATTSVYGITANENVTVTAGGTLSTASGHKIATISVSTGKTFDLGTQSISTAAGTGFIKIGEGDLKFGSSGAGTYAGGFTLNQGKVILGGAVNSFGTGILTLNGGTISANGTQSFSDTKLSSIVIGGDITLGDETNISNISFGTSTATTTTMTLGNSAIRSINLSGTGVYTFWPIITGVGSSISINATAAGTIVFGNNNTYDGSTTVNGGTLQLNAAGGALKSGNAVNIGGGVFKISQSQTIGDFTMTSGTLQIDAGQSLIITGTYNSTGGFINNKGTIILQGSTPQSFPGNATINNGTAGLMTALTINNSVGVSISGTFATTTLNINAGAKLTNSGSLTATTFNILSDVTNGTGTYVDNGTTTIIGTVSVQQYLSSARNWYISSPVSKAVSPSGFTYYKRDEAGASWTTIPFSVGDDFVAGTGYIALPDVIGSTITFTTKSGEHLNTGNIDVALTSSGATTTGYNLIGNPYPCHLTWTAAFVDDGTNVGKIEPTIWVRTNAGSVNSGGDASWSFLTYNAHSGEASPLTTILTGGIIPPMQAFWVKAKVASTLLTLDDKLTRSHQSSNPIKARAVNNSTNRQRLRLELSNGTLTDETLVYFDAAATNGFDAYDSHKFPDVNAAVQIYTTAGNEKLVINGLNNIPVNTELPLGFTTGQSNAFSIKATEFSNFDSNTKVYLKDKLLGTESDLTGDIAYTFASDIASTTDRFSLVFKVVGNTTDIYTAADNQSTLIYKNVNNQIVVNCKDIISSDAIVLVYNAICQELQTKQITGTTTVIDKNFNSGVYVVTVNNAGKSTTKKVILN